MVDRLIVSYRGTAYAGWQRQDNAPSVQQALEEALAGLFGAPVRAVAAGRTDAGVHARGQSVHLEPGTGETKTSLRPFPERALVHGVNHRLPSDIRVLGADRMRPGFDARKHASAKEYRYRLLRRRVLSPLDAPFAVRAPEDLDVAALRRAAAALPGRHDWSAFALAGGSHAQPVRRLFEAEWLEDGPELVLRVLGEGFLRGMVRSLVGTLLEVGRGKRTVEDFVSLLAGAPRSAAGPTAPPEGLVLERVLYPPGWRVEP